jgi:hypothetical protein
MIGDRTEFWALGRALGMNRVIARYAGADPSAGWLPKAASLELPI